MQKFIDVLSRCEAKSLSQLEAAELLGMSERTFRRYLRRYEEEGLDGLQDRRLGKPPAKAAALDEIDWMLEQYSRHHEGWTVRHFHDHLKKHRDFKWSYSWTKNHLQAAGLVRRAKKRGAHRRKRERKPCVGMMLHQDGSTHEWLEGQPMFDLIVTMDDATSKVYSAFFVEEEGTLSTFRGLLEVFESKGLPSSFYTDRGSHYFITPEAGGKVDKQNLTQVGRALKQLGVEHIPAYSPEARGRSERAFATFQSRLVKEMKLAGITDMQAANAYLRETYLPDHNRRFAVEAALPESGFVPVADKNLLRDTLCAQHERTVGRDNTISFAGRKLQLPESPLRRHFVKARVRVHEYPDETLAVFHGPRKIASYDNNFELIEPKETARTGVAA